MLKFNLKIILFVLILFSGCTTTSNSVAPSLTPESQVKNILKTGANTAFSIFGNPKDFLTNALIEAIIPQGLKDINAKLTQMGLNSVVDKQKQIVGEVAKTSLNIMQPLVLQSIQNITPADAIAIISGGKGAATKYLREKTEAQLIKSLRPTISSELNKYGATKLLNTALNSSGIGLDKLIGGFVGSKPNSNDSTGNQLESLITTQLVNGLYHVMLDSEKKNSFLKNSLNTILNNQ